MDSYNAGYARSDGIRRGVVGVLEGTDVESMFTMMDTKRHRSEAFKQAAALKVKALIDALKPDVVIAADDNVFKYLIKPYFRNTTLAFVFCGVNWDAGDYGYPCSNVTGMIEVTPVPQLLDDLKHYAKGGRVGFRAPDLLSAKKEIIEYRKAFAIDLVACFSSDAIDLFPPFDSMTATSSHSTHEACWRTPGRKAFPSDPERSIWLGSSLHSMAAFSDGIYGLDSRPNRICHVTEIGYRRLIAISFG